MTDKAPKLLDQVRARIRVMHYSIRTEQAYVDWTRRFILFHHKRHPRDMGKAELEAFLSYLAVERRVSASTQSQAKSALLFLYQQVLGLDRLSDIVAAKQPHHLPTVLTVNEAQAVLRRLSGVTGLIGQLLYGSGLRLLEACRLRVQDVDFDMRQIMVRDGKGAKDRITMLPTTIIEPLQQHLRLVKAMHDDDLRAGLGEVYLPFALDHPHAPREWRWQYVFPADHHAGGAAGGDGGGKGVISPLDRW